MGKTVRRRVLKTGNRDPFPWWPVLLLVLTLALFWALPRRLGDAPVKVEFTGATR